MRELDALQKQQNRKYFACHGAGKLTGLGVPLHYSRCCSASLAHARPTMFYIPPSRIWFCNICSTRWMYVRAAFRSLPKSCPYQLLSWLPTYHFNSGTSLLYYAPFGTCILYQAPFGSRFYLVESVWHGCNIMSLPFLPVQPFIIPRVSHAGDTRNFERYPEDSWYNVPPLRDQDIEPFKNFWFLLSPLILILVY